MPASSCRSTIRAWRRTTTARRTPPIEDCRKFIALRVEAVNHALRGIPEDRVRFHTCYSVNVAPRVHDFELRHFVDLMLQVNARRLSRSRPPTRGTSTNGRSGRTSKLPDGKILIPGVVSHCMHLVEHPELVAQRIERFARVVGRERRHRRHRLRLRHLGAGDEVHPDVAWAKLRPWSKARRSPADAYGNRKSGSEPYFQRRIAYGNRALTPIFVGL